MTEPRKPARIRPILALMALLTFLSMAAGGFLYLKALRDTAIRETHHRAEVRALSIADHVDGRLIDHQKAVRTLAGLPTVIRALQRGSDGALQDGNAVLDQFTSALEVEVCYVMNIEGTTVASSNRHQPDSFVGKNYAFRPYFREAFAGRAAPYMALGVTSSRRGVYFGSPIYQGEDEGALGVAVIKAPIEPITRELSTAQDGLVFLVDPNGVIFDANRGETLLHLFREVPPEQAAKIAATRQFGQGPWPWIGFRAGGPGVLEDSAGGRFSFHEAALEALPGWKVLYLHDLEDTERAASAPLFDTAVFFALSLGILLAVILLLYRKGSGEIGQRRKYEEALRLSGERHRKVFENTGTATLIVDADMSIMHANSEFEKLSGYTKKEIEGRIQWPLFVYEQDVERLKTYHAERRQEGGEAPAEYEFRFRDRQGRLKNVIARVTMMPETRESIVALTDVTPLRQAESLFRDLFLHAELGLYILQQGHFRMINPQFEKLTGYTQAELRDRQAMDLVYPGDQEHVRRSAARMLKGESVQPYEYRGVRKDGSVRWLMETATPVTFQGQPAVLANFMDITAGKKTEAERVKVQRLESIGFLAAGIAHDFNNLLTAIMGNIDLAEMLSPDNGRIHGNLKEARKASLRARDLARQLLTFAPGGAPVKAEGSLLGCVRSRAERALRETAVELEIEAPQALWPVEFDSRQVEQLADILVGNAAEAMQGKGRLEVTLANVRVQEAERDAGFPLGPGRYVQVSVRDEGPGIPEANLGKLFDPYFSTKQRGTRKGLGLGLTTAHSIVRRHGGHLQIDSLAGAGTTVSFYIPVLADAA